MEMEKQRSRIDAADQALVRLLNRRMGLAVRLGRWKRQRGLPLLDAAREREILRRARSLNGGPLDARAVSGFFRWLLRESRRLTSRALRESNGPARRAAR